ncbi:tripartite tricarboxylate transporter substrate binding protein [Pigmentiphaga sp. GD03639]|jgi:tripartite-type tricarboxylate transporter receptor subunit TctC|uniref:Tripartite tricarboxylate transporter substrate binding protein n=1 Tax=Pigmentiphaga daeguensis TaxID=414049 RepID=A0ABN1C1I7_9BURK|nr:MULTISPECIES: tripartite tricarboxylate transporter substrate binding protein [unclassified Pigmentiphaga]MDH2236046.1 tripartite tricarboxylate transporter substrate binding protein [Pigmentiphaga sp. GD03639]OVZ62119.1 MFS transporter [Pigmentiphaga sp. NML030171]
MRHFPSSARAACLAALASLALAGPAAAASYPDKPVRVVVGFSAGGTTDVAARIIAKELGDDLGQSFVVENKPGAGSNIGAELVARAKPDGYTLYMVAVTSTINQTLYKNLSFDIVKDFSPIALVIKVPNILVVNPSLPVKNVKELVAYVKAHPDKLSYASSGSGTSIHMAGELFKLRAGVDIPHIPYKGSAPALTDLIGNQVQLMFDNMPSAWPHVQAGKLRALAVTTAERSATAPELPTMMESGYDKFDVSSWFGLIAPKGTPPDVIARINASVQKALAKPDVQQRFKDLGAVTAKTTPEQFGAFIKDEVETWATVVKASGAKVE